MTDRPDPIIFSPDSGFHNADLSQTVARLRRDIAWKDTSFITMSPAGGSVPTRVVGSWTSLIRPPNGKSHHLYAIGVEVGEAYSAAVAGILGHPDLGRWKYLVTLEHDNAPPPDGYVRLIRQMEAHPELSAIGGLYFTKGPEGVAQIWGDPKEIPLSFRPQLPDPNGGLVECCGTGMGFTMFRLDMFRDPRLRRPWFKTPASQEEGVATQDLYFWGDAYQYGYRCAVDCSVRVGHYDAEHDIMW